MSTKLSSLPVVMCTTQNHKFLTSLLTNGQSKPVLVTANQQIFSLWTWFSVGCLVSVDDVVVGQAVEKAAGSVLFTQVPVGKTV